MENTSDYSLAHCFFIQTTIRVTENLSCVVLNLWSSMDSKSKLLHIISNNETFTKDFKVFLIIPKSSHSGSSVETEVYAVCLFAGEP